MPMPSVALGFAAVVVLEDKHAAVKMSTGDVVCTGWLIKSPPEKKLKRYTWRKRWFVLRRGRMSGDPDVLEYYQSKSSKKPIRTIDLKESEVKMQTDQLILKRAFSGKHLFVVKTSLRIFYLVAKTEEEMNRWIQGISQICHFAPLEDAGPHHASTAAPLTTNHDESMLSEHSYPMDYLFLSQCETGRSVSIRCDSFSNSETSLEQKSSDDIVEDNLSSSLSINTASSFAHTGLPTFTDRRMSNPPFSAPCTPMAYDRPCKLTASSSSPLARSCTTAFFQFDKHFSSELLEASTDGQTPPPLPPKPFSEQLRDEGAHGRWGMSAQGVSGQPTLISSRLSLSSLDHVRTGDIEAKSSRVNMLSLNLPPLNTFQNPNDAEDPDHYIPMASPPAFVTGKEFDGYIPMSPLSMNFLKTNCTAESPISLTSGVCQLGDLVPPPVNRHLKPPRTARPPPLDLRDLATIKECSTHPPLSIMTDPSNSNILLLERRHDENGENKEDEDTSCNATSWARRSNLDYLSLDFNSASPSPTHKKPLLADEDRVDYVQVDEKKTQALQNTKMEWNDVRQNFKSYKENTQ